MAYEVCSFICSGPPLWWESRRRMVVVVVSDAHSFQLRDHHRAHTTGTTRYCNGPTSKYVCSQADCPYKK